MSRLTATPVPPIVRRIVGVLLTGCALVLIGPDAQAGIRLPATIMIGAHQPRSSGSANPGYLPLVGSPALRCLRREPLPVPTLAPVVLYNPAPATQPPEMASLPTSETVRSEPTEPPTVQPKDFLPYFQRNNNPPPVATSPNEGLMFAPARPALPSSSADFRQQ